MHLVQACFVLLKISTCLYILCILRLKCCCFTLKYLPWGINEVCQSVYMSKLIVRKPTSESLAHQGGILPADSFPFWVSLNNLLATSTGFLIPDRKSSISITFAQDSFKYDRWNLHLASSSTFVEEFFGVHCTPPKKEEK